MNDETLTFEQTQEAVNPNPKLPFETPRVEDLGELQSLTQEFGGSI